MAWPTRPPEVPPSVVYLELAKSLVELFVFSEKFKFSVGDFEVEGVARRDEYEEFPIDCDNAISLALSRASSHSCAICVVWVKSELLPLGSSNEKCFSFCRHVSVCS